MGKAYVWSDTLTYITTPEICFVVSGVKRESGKPEYCRPAQRGLPACVVQARCSRVPWSPRTARGKSELCLVGLVINGVHGLQTGDCRPNPTDVFAELHMMVLNCLLVSRLEIFAPRDFKFGTSCSSLLQSCFQPHPNNFQQWQKTWWWILFTKPS
jgi:hypothetical protein